MSVMRFDTTPWLQPPGVMVFGVGGFGVPAQTIPATGANGPAFTFPSLSPADNGKEICGHITRFPSAGTFDATEDTSFAFTAPDGTYKAQFTLYADGVAVGSAEIDLQVGAQIPVNPRVYGQGRRDDDEAVILAILQALQ